ncbi:MAG: UDP-N-acetylmuramoyl-L-alanyl-D-glutamate--2,6-diaminopimelate ligase, partial [Lentisphaeria bacterium]|nr:UDP-N-acetylmuramoyl-L-alanyl-D-glutamate--2,6-diaminopimelate ligase [Lentisphaeria bacterium]
MLGVTGTNGKTTTAFLLEHIFTRAGRPCGLISTVEYRDGRGRYESTNTT